MWQHMYKIHDSLKDTMNPTLCFPPHDTTILSSVKSGLGPLISNTNLVLDHNLNQILVVGPQAAAGSLQALQPIFPQCSSNVFDTVVVRAAAVECGCEADVTECARRLTPLLQETNASPTPVSFPLSIEHAEQMPLLAQIHCARLDKAALLDEYKMHQNITIPLFCNVLCRSLFSHIPIIYYILYMWSFLIMLLHWPAFYFPAMPWNFPYNCLPMHRLELFAWTMTDVRHYMLYCVFVVITASIRLVPLQILRCMAWVMWMGCCFCDEHDWPECARWFELHFKLVAWYSRQMKRFHNWCCHIYGQYLAWNWKQKPLHPFR